jgi:glycine/D-amino acid oxidase-like deaminating enzyme
MKGPNDRMISIEEMQEMVGSCEKPNLGAGEELWLNKNIGLVNFDLSVEAVAEMAEKASVLGIGREKKDITRLIIGGGGGCLGVEAGDYSVVAKETILAAGPWTPRRLDRSEIEYSSDFFTVVGVGVATMPLEEKEFDELKSTPILVTEEDMFNSLT